jgi:hypothetical protein
MRSPIEQGLDHVRVRGEDPRLGPTRLRGFMLGALCALFGVACLFTWPEHLPAPPAPDLCIDVPEHTRCQAVLSLALERLPDPDLLWSWRTRCGRARPEVVEVECRSMHLAVRGWQPWERRALGDDLPWALALAGERFWGHRDELERTMAAMSDAPRVDREHMALVQQQLRDEIARLQAIQERLRAGQGEQALSGWKVELGVQHRWWVLTLGLVALATVLGLGALGHALLVFQRTGGVDVDVRPQRLRVGDESWEAHDLSHVEIDTRHIQITTLDGRLHVRAVGLSPEAASALAAAAQVLVARTARPEDPAARQALDAVLDRGMT